METGIANAKKNNITTFTTSKYLTYKEWKLVIKIDSDREDLCEYLTYKEWKQVHELIRREILRLLLLCRVLPP